MPVRRRVTTPTVFPPVSAQRGPVGKSGSCEEKSLTMYTIHPAAARMLAGNLIDEQVRDARRRRLARDARAARRAPVPDQTPQPHRRSWSFVLLRRAFG